MRTHRSTLAARLARAASRSTCRYRVAAVALDRRGRPIGLATNLPRLPGRDWHAEERLLHRSPPTLAVILVARIGANGDFLPIEPCEHCRRLAERRKVAIRPL